MVVKFVLTFGAGVYAGVYLSQNYNVPKVDEPQELFRKTVEYVKTLSEKYKKD